MGLNKEIEVGKKYKNFRGYERIVKEIYESGDGRKRIKYDDDTGIDRECYYDSFLQWIKKVYY